MSERNGVDVNRLVLPFDRWGGDEESPEGYPASNEDGTPAIVEGDEVIVRETWTDEYGQHFVTVRHPIDGKRFHWHNAEASNGVEAEPSRNLES